MRVLAIGAHFDDIELGCGGTLASLVDQGHSVFGYVATRSGFANPAGEAIRNDAEAAEEGRLAASVVGYELIVGSRGTFELDVGDSLNSDIRALIERVGADTVFSAGTHDVHSDHWSLARATIHAARHVPRLAFYRSNWYASERPFQANLFFDVTATFARKMEALGCYRSEWERAGHLWADFFSRAAQNDGLALGTAYAEGFETARWLMP